VQLTAYLLTFVLWVYDVLITPLSVKSSRARCFDVLLAPMLHDGFYYAIVAALICMTTTFTTAAATIGTTQAVLARLCEELAVRQQQAASLLTQLEAAGTEATAAEATIQSQQHEARRLTLQLAAATSAAAAAGTSADGSAAVDADTAARTAAAMATAEAACEQLQQLSDQQRHLKQQVVALRADVAQRDATIAGLAAAQRQQQQHHSQGSANSSSTTTASASSWFGRRSSVASIPGQPG
jgi:predicted  nucleic acid-binding Zn-ribbon protein